MKHRDIHAPEPNEWTLDGPDGDVIEVFGSLLGRATSAKDEHNHDGEYAPKGERCSACRWFDVLIIDASEDEDAGDDYLVYTCGRTIVPGEKQRPRLVWTSSARVVLSALIVRQGGQPKLPVASDRALAQAALYDEDIADAYDNRLVA